MTPFVIDFLVEGHGDHPPVDEKMQFSSFTRNNTMQQNDKSFCCDEGTPQRRSHLMSRDHNFYFYFIKRCMSQRGRAGPDARDAMLPEFFL